MKKTKKEIWKPIPGFPSYDASTKGRIRRSLTAFHVSGATQGKVLVPTAYGPRKGYLCVILCEPDKPHEKRLVHRLVAATFLGPCPKSFQVNHKDLNKHNCKPSNLEYVTRSENMQHAVKNGVQMGGNLPGELSSTAIFSNAQVHKIRKYWASGKYTQSSIARMYGADRSTICRIVNHEHYVGAL